MTIKLRLFNFVQRILLSPKREVLDSDIEYLLWMVSLYKMVSNVPGHVAEIGVASGRNAVIFGKLIKLFGDSAVRRYYGFDTFKGYLARDLESDAHLSATAFTDIDFSAVQERLIIAGLEQECQLIKGDAVKEVPRFLHAYSDHRIGAGMGKFSLLYIDCNAYKPALSSMESFFPFLSPGAVIAIDEKRQGSETRALYDFAKGHGLQVQYLGVGNVPALIQLV